MIKMGYILRVLFGTDSFFNCWGPGIHLHIADMLLEKCEGVLKNIEFLKKYRNYFLYGSVAPDITLGKKYIREIEKHCHSWNTGFALLNNSKNDEERAVAYGYLVHLASDIIAHNYYIPKEMLASRGLRGIVHTVLELKADSILFKDTKELLEEVLSVDFSKENEFIKSNISEAVLPFGINRKIFEYSLKGSKSHYFHGALKKVTSYEKWIIDKRKILEEYYETSYALAFDILKNGADSIAVKYDPNGETHIRNIGEVKKEIRNIEIDDVHMLFYRIPKELKELKNMK